MSTRRCSAWLLLAAVVLAPLAAAHANWLDAFGDFQPTFGYDPKAPPAAFSAQLVATNIPANALWPGDAAKFTVQIINRTDQPLAVRGRIRIIRYGTRSNPLDMWGLNLVKLADVGDIPVNADIPANGFVDKLIEPAIPETFGAYALVLELDGQPEGKSRLVFASCLRVPAVEPGKVQNPTYAMDLQHMAFAPLFQRVGIKGTRNEINYIDRHAASYADQVAQLERNVRTLGDHDITVMWTLSTGGNQALMPLGTVRSLLNDAGEGPMGYPGDFTMLPQHDADFQAYVKEICGRMGWPKGPVNAIELWNEPWEGSSISGWGADMPRYRELYTAMAQGVVEARASDGVQVLIGGACSSMNTEDKLFGDGKDDFLKWLDFNSIHYQPMCAMPVLIRKWQERQSEYGPVQTWDTESWIANSEDRVAVAIASMRAQGQTRTAGVFHDPVRHLMSVDARQADGTSKRVEVVHPMPTAAGIAAVQHFIGQRPFREILFKNGLPWVFVFDGREGKGADDGTVVVVGDLGGVYERGLTLFHSVLGQAADRRVAELNAKLAALPAGASDDERKALVNQAKITAFLDQATMMFDAGGGAFTSFDFYGNALPAQDGKITVPLDTMGYFLRTDGSAGSFAKLLDAIRASRIEGYEPLDVMAHDMLARVEKQPVLKLTLTNILNRPISGKLSVTLGGLTLEGAEQTVEFAAHETKIVELKVTGGTATEDNAYPLSLTFDAGADGAATHAETMHVNVVPKKTITVDGKLEDWEGVPPQPIRAQADAGKNMTEKAWLPFVKFDETVGAGVASGFVAYDENHFYFAAKIADHSPYDGNLRYATRDDDQFYYPETVTRVWQENGETKRQELKWPQGVRRFSYRTWPAIPSGDSTDNVQVAFNVLPIEKTEWLSHPAGTMPRFMVYKTSDYEYAFNPVREKDGGGAEMWRLLAPGVPRKHFYPRQGKAEKDGGPVEGGRLVMTRAGNTRLVEAAIPWSELPDVKARLDAGETIKFTFRVNDNQGAGYELNGGRSVSKINTYALHNYWSTSWAVETEFAFE